MSRYCVLSLGLLLSASLNVGCGGSGAVQEDASLQDDGGQPACNIIEITHDVDANTTWDGDHVYVIRQSDFYVNATLVIEPGAVIKFTADGPDMSVGGNGVINAQGTAEKPILFTSVRDDSDGCDVDGDGDTTQPARRDWGSVDLNGTHGSIFDNCFFFYGGKSANSGTLVLSADATARVTSSLFAHNDGSHATGRYGALDATGAEAGTVIQNNVFYDNIRPLSVRTTFDVDDSNVFHDPGDPTQTNDYNGIFVESDDIGSHLTWEETEVPFVIGDNDFWVLSGFTLTLGDNVVVKLRPDSELLLADGDSALVNHDGTGVYFTSYRDDTLLGDTNGDGSATSPAAGDWDGIYNDSTSSYVGWSNILYATH